MVNVAIVGAGFIAKVHAEAYKKISNAKIVSISDASEEKGSLFANQYGCKYYLNFEEMIGNEEIDVVDICLPTFLHKEYIEKSFLYDKDVFCEKPVTLNLNMLDEIIDASNRSGRNLFVGQVLRFWEEYIEAKRMYDNNEFGEINYIFANRLSEHPKWNGWYKFSENSGGGLLDLHLHDIDFLCWTFGDVKSVYSVGKKNKYNCWNHVNTILKFNNGMVANVSGVIEMKEGYPFTMSLIIDGENKTYKYVMEAGANLDDTKDGTRYSVLYPDKKLIDHGKKDAYEVELRHFIDCIENKCGSDIINLQSIRKVFCTIEAVKKSLENKCEVNVEY